jgi:hypothetical protein
MKQARKLATWAALALVVPFVPTRIVRFVLQ